MTAASAGRDRRRFEALPDEAESHRQMSVRKTRKEVRERPHAGSAAHGFRIQPNSGIGGKIIKAVLLLMKLYHDTDRTRANNKTGKDLLHAGSTALPHLDIPAIHRPNGAGPDQPASH